MFASTLDILAILAVLLIQVALAKIPCQVVEESGSDPYCLVYYNEDSTSAFSFKLLNNGSFATRMLSCNFKKKYSEKIRPLGDKIAVFKNGKKKKDIQDPARKLLPPQALSGDEDRCSSALGILANHIKSTTDDCESLLQKTCLFYEEAEKKSKLRFFNRRN